MWCVNMKYVMKYASEFSELKSVYRERGGGKGGRITSATLSLWAISLSSLFRQQH